MAQQYLDKAGLTYFWDKIKSKFLRGNVGGVFYGTCSTAAGTVAKVVECADFTAGNLKAGTIIVVSFSATNSGAVASLTMNVNGTGAKPIKYINNGTLGNLSSAGYLKANTEYPFYYDGANWVCWFNVNTTYSALSEADMHTGTATNARLITAQRLKQAVEYHAPVTSVNGSTGAVTVTEGLAPLIGTTSTVTPQQVMTALGEGRDICISTSTTINNIPVELKFTSWNRATDTEYGGQAIDVAVSQTIARLNSVWFVFELIGGTYNGVSMPWDVLSADLATNDDVTELMPHNISELSNDVGYITLSDLPIYNGGVS